jgi:Fe2+ or Zn2+ uptake regulation protein
MSKQKEVIYVIVASTMTHPTADWVYQQARMEMPQISLGTVYRNLKSLCQEGRLLEITTTKGPSRYDANVSRHSHLRCTRCDRLEDVTEKELSFRARSKKLHGFRIHEFRIEMMGRCPDCQKAVVN